MHILSVPQERRHVVKSGCSGAGDMEECMQTLV